MDAGGRRGRIALVLGAVLLGLAGCQVDIGPTPRPTGIVAPDGKSVVPLSDANGTVVATGRVVDADNQPVVGATVFLMLEPGADVLTKMKPGDILPETAVRVTISEAGGFFSIRIPPQAIVADASKQDGDFNFQVEAFGSYPPGPGTTMGIWAFPLRLEHGSFVGTPAPITVTVHPGS